VQWEAVPVIILKLKASGTIRAEADKLGRVTFDKYNMAGYGLDKHVIGNSWTIDIINHPDVLDALKNREPNYAMTEGEKAIIIAWAKEQN